MAGGFKIKKANLLLTPPEYNVKVDWTAGEVAAVPPRRGKEDKYGIWLLPPPKKIQRGISSQFANLRDNTKKDFRKRFKVFVSTFGLLGITGLPTEKDAPFAPPQYGKSSEEDITWWLHYANEVYCLLRLYRILKRAKDNREYDAERPREVLIFKQRSKVSHAVHCRRMGSIPILKMK